MKVFTRFLFLHLIVLNANSIYADADTTIAAQQTACSANSAKVWDSEKNRCVEKVETGTYRKDSVSCNDITDIEQRKACQLSLASSKTGISESGSAALDKVSSLQSRSALINAAGTVISVINMLGSSSGQSKCMSKNILAATSIGGTITDILMKIKTKKAGDELLKKYQISKSDSPYTAQYKALEYLKESEKTVKEIAELEKKRQMLLSIGYGAAFATAAYEQFYNHGTCTGEKKTEPSPTPSASPSATPTATPSTEVTPTPSATPSAVPTTAATPTPTPVAATVAEAKQETTSSRQIQETLDSKTNTYHHAVVETSADGTKTVTGVIHNNQYYPYSTPQTYSSTKIYYATGSAQSISSAGISYSSSSFIGGTAKYLPKTSK